MSQHKAMPRRHFTAHIRELQADLDTPLAIYLKLANVPNSYLFESVHGGEKWSRYSIIGLQANETVQVFGNTVEHLKDGEVIERTEVSDPLQWLEAFNSQFQVDTSDSLPRFCGGLVGYFGYDTVRMIEPSIPKPDQTDVIDVPDILLMVSTQVIVVDNLMGKIFLIVHYDSDEQEQAVARLDELEDLLQTQRIDRSLASASESINEESFSSSFDEEQFKDAVVKVKQYIRDGEVMQVVLSQRLSIDFSYEPLSLYRALRQLNPSPYMFYVNLGEFQIVGSSPEILVRLEDDQVTVRPIAGTRRRGRTEAEDKALEEELLADPKELAEHLMLIDLGRNDAGRVCQTGKVALTEKMAIERYSHVMHIVSNVVGDVDKKYNVFDVLRATFPAGTVSGAPKIRALSIIDELEPVKRGIYSGAVGYIGWNGNLDTAIAIRTAVIKDDKLYVQAGAGIVHDSQPELEWKETMNKARVVFKAVSLVAQGKIR